MGTKLPPQQLELYQALDKLLLQEWDPIGISDCEGAEDEYQGYLPKVFSLVLSNASSREIAEYLNWVITERMSMNENMQHSLNIAEKCLQAKTNAGL